MNKLLCDQTDNMLLQHELREMEVKVGKKRTHKEMLGGSQLSKKRVTQNKRVAGGG